MADLTALAEALRARKQVTLFYTKVDGTSVTHTGGLYEVRADSVWLWDTQFNDNIRKFLPGSIVSFQVLDADFIPPYPWPIKLFGEVV